MTPIFINFKGSASDSDVIVTLGDCCFEALRICFEDTFAGDGNVLSSPRNDLGKLNYSYNNGEFAAAFIAANKTDIGEDLRIVTKPITDKPPFYTAVVQVGSGSYDLILHVCYTDTDGTTQTTFNAPLRHFMKNPQAAVVVPQKVNVGLRRFDVPAGRAADFRTYMENAAKDWFAKDWLTQ